LPATTTNSVFTLSLHDALPILPKTTLGEGSEISRLFRGCDRRHLDGIAVQGATDFRVRAGQLVETGERSFVAGVQEVELVADHQDRKSTRLNSSHVKISYAVFC